MLSKTRAFLLNNEGGPKMSELKRFITGNTDLDQINLQIAAQEAAGAGFRQSIIAAKDGQPINEVTFEILPPGTRPKELKIVKHNDSQPPGTKKVWEGVMIVAGTLTVVTAYRPV
jgi:hypothetical protein